LFAAAEPSVQEVEKGELQGTVRGHPVQIHRQVGTDTFDGLAVLTKSA
jgi:hypothetical protein